MALADLEPQQLRLRPTEATLASRPARVGIPLRFASADALAAGLGGTVLVSNAASVPPSVLHTVVASVVLVVGWLGAVWRSGAYRDRVVEPARTQVLRVVRAGADLAVLTAALAWWFLPDLSVAVVLAAAAATVGLSATHRAATATAGLVLPGRRVPPRRLVVVGHHPEARQVADDLERRAGSSLRVVGVCAPDLDSVPDKAVALAADGVVMLPDSLRSPAATRRLAWRLAENDQHLLASPGLVDVHCHRTSVAVAGGLSLVHVEHARSRCPQRTATRLCGRTAAVCGLMVIAPLLLALALAIRAESPGPALFRQTRIGKDGVPFTMFKFRTMRGDAALRRSDLEASNEGAGVLFKLRGDPRVTRLGAVLRRYSLDELPQLINVARGEMALVGPRPALPEEVAAYAPDTRRRLATAPGITGLWQVSGRSDLDWNESVRLDLSYVDNWSPLLDARILLRTVTAVVGHRGAY